MFSSAAASFRERLWDYMLDGTLHVGKLGKLHVGMGMKGDSRNA